jgi:NAD(P)-dependent dehydrogenase (short-subunit alcohol dehydrogenase family)
MERMQNKVALVTGAAGRLGSAICRRIVSEGGKVVIADIAFDRAQELAEELGTGVAFAVHLDAQDDASVEKMVADAAAKWGQLDILVNNVAYTGVAGTAIDSTVLDTTIETWDATFAINVRSLFLATKFALPHLLKRPSGAIVNMGSVSGLGGDSMYVAYGASKAAVAHFGRYIAVQYGRQGVRCNTICPGPTGTAGRPEALLKTALNAAYTPSLGEPEHIAALVAYLASDEAGNTNGTVIACDGGFDAGITPWRPSQFL